MGKWVQLVIATGAYETILDGDFTLAHHYRLAMKTGNHRLIAADHYQKLWRSRVAQVCSVQTVETVAGVCVCVFSSDSVESSRGDTEILYTANSRE